MGSSTEHNFQRKRIFLKAFYEVTITMILKPDKNITHTHTHKYYRAISLMHIDANILNKILAN